MIDLNNGWRLEVDRGDNWLFIRVASASRPSLGEPPIAAEVVRIIHETRIQRVIVELDESVTLFSFLVGQLVTLHKRVLLAGGVFRICNMRPSDYRILEAMQLANRFPNYTNRSAAMNGTFLESPDDRAM